MIWMIFGIVVFVAMIYVIRYFLKREIKRRIGRTFNILYEFLDILGEDTKLSGSVFKIIAKLYHGFLESDVDMS